MLGGSQVSASTSPDASASARPLEKRLSGLLGRAIRVVSVSHIAVSRAMGRLRYHPFAERSDLAVHLVAPAKWYEFGRHFVADSDGDPGVRLHILPILFGRAGRALWYLHIYPGLGGLLSTVDPDVLHLAEEPWSFVALQACLLKGSAALVLEVDQNILKRLPPPFETIRRFVLAKTDHILSRGPEMTDVVRACGYVGPVTEIGYGVDTATFFPRETPAPPISPNQGGPLTIGYVGRLVPEKGLDDAIDAMAEARVPINFLVMGEGPYEAALRERIVARGLSETVSITGWDGPSAVGAFIRRLDVLILPSRTTSSWKEQFGRTIIEAQACGVPVIGSSSGSIPNVVGAGGWIFPEGDPVALARCLEAIAGDPIARAVVSSAAIANVKERFTYKAVAEALATSWIAAAETAFTRNTRSR
jgi:glycosyltransferase involved in cell wall biosynthesis